MKFKWILMATALIALTSFAFAQPNDVTFSYYNGGGGEPALTSDGNCFAGTPIPDGAAQVEVWLVGGGMLGSYPMNGSSTVGGPGYFYGLDYYLGAGAADYVYCVVSLEGCTYTSDHFGPVGSGGASVNYTITCPTYPSNCEWSCNCGNPGCEVIEEYSSE